VFYILRRVDAFHILRRVDAFRILRRVDVFCILRRVDVFRILRRVDVFCILSGRGRYYDCTQSCFITTTCYDASSAVTCAKCVGNYCQLGMLRYLKTLLLSRYLIHVNLCRSLVYYASRKLQNKHAEQHYNSTSCSRTLQC
jgi:hypothetical protein